MAQPTLTIVKRRPLQTSAPTPASEPLTIVNYRPLAPPAPVSASGVSLGWDLPSARARFEEFELASARQDIEDDIRRTNRHAPTLEPVKPMASHAPPRVPASVVAAAGDDAAFLTPHVPQIVADETMRGVPIEAGNIDLYAQPKVTNPAGGESTVFSRSFGLDGREVLLPSVTPDGRFLATDDEVLAEYTKTGRRLGKFATPEDATAFAEKLHTDYASGRYDKPLTFAQAFGRGIDVAQQMGYGAIEATGELVGSETLAKVGGEGRWSNQREIEAAGAGTTFGEALSSIDAFGQWAKKTIGGQIPILAPMVAGGIVGAKVGALAGPYGSLVGGLIGAFLPGEVLGVGETQITIKERGQNAQAPVAAFVGGTAVAALDSVLPGKIGGRLVRVFGKELAEEVAKRTLLKPVTQGLLRRTAQGAISGMATEGLTEALQASLSEMAAAGERSMDVQMGRRLSQFIDEFCFWSHSSFESVKITPRRS